MKATELLQKQHREIEDLLERLKNATAENEKALREQLAAALMAHTVAEQQIVYPALTDAAPELIQEAYEEHTLIHYELARQMTAKSRDMTGRARTNVLARLVASHVRLEEHEVFRKAEATLSNQEQMDLGGLLSQRHEEIMAQGTVRTLALAIAANAPKLAVRGVASRKAQATRRRAAKPQKATRAATQRGKQAQTRVAKPKRAVSSARKSTQGTQRSQRGQGTQRSQRAQSTQRSTRAQRSRRAAG